MSFLAEDCSRCGREMLFLEGPICDECLDFAEKCPPGTDPLWAWREENRNDPEVSVFWSRVDDEGPRMRGKPTFLADLTTRAIIFCCGEARAR